MPRFYSQDYNKIVLLSKKNHSWSLKSRSNVYKFYTTNGVVTIEEFVNRLGITSILDYGCGFGQALDNIDPNISVQKYDLFVPEFKEHPTEASELTVCFNVLNCVEPDYFNEVINDIHSLTTKFLLLNIKIPGFYNKESDWYIDKFKSDLFEIIDSHLIDTIFTSVVKEKHTLTIIEDRHEVHTSLFLLLKVKKLLPLSSNG